MVEAKSPQVAGVVVLPLMRSGKPSGPVLLTKPVDLPVTEMPLRSSVPLMLGAVPLPMEVALVRRNNVVHWTVMLPEKLLAGLVKLTMPPLPLLGPMVMPLLPVIWPLTVTGIGPSGLML